MSRRNFVKTTAAFSAAIAGIPPYNLSSIANTILKDDSELIIYPFLYRSVNGIFQILDIKLWGCNWDCKWCTNKFQPLNKAVPITVSIDEIIDLSGLMRLDASLPTLFVISGGEPLLQKVEVLELIASLKRKTDYTVSLETNGHLIDENFIEKANKLNLDRIDISFRNIDDNWHRWYTGGYSNQHVIDALKLATEAFDGLIGVPIILFPAINEVIFEKMCKFLHEINPDFIIRMMYPIREPYDEHQLERYLRNVNRMGKIASHYFYRIFPDPDNLNAFLPREMAQYEVRRTYGGVDITKSWRWKRGEN
jgi:molybdenum cofactor biosynthesis enzyme MoaA